MKSGLVGVVGAIMLALGMLALGRAKVPAGSFPGMPAQASPCSAPGVIYTAADAADAADDSSEDARPSDQDIVRRRREYASAFVISAGILLIAIIGAFVFRRRAAAAAGIAALAALGMGALLQFTASKGLPMFFCGRRRTFGWYLRRRLHAGGYVRRGGWNDAAARDATGDGSDRDRRDSMVGNSCICRRSRPHA